MGAMRLALFQPDIAQNTGTLLRLGACLDVPVDVIEPCGFVFASAAMRRAGLDYWEQARFARHASWTAFRDQAAGRIVLLSTRAATPYVQFAFQPDDILLLGRESAGVPPDVHAAAGASVRIPMRPSLRSLNVALAAAMVLGEALRQTRGPEWSGQ
jgi:tRNA (cytidine/uridine-2'-O-)-methyltransferase